MPAGGKRKQALSQIYFDVNEARSLQHFAGCQYVPRTVSIGGKVLKPQKRRNVVSAIVLSALTDRKLDISEECQTSSHGCVRFLVLSKKEI